MMHAVVRLCALLAVCCCLHAQINRGSANTIQQGDASAVADNSAGGTDSYTGCPVLPTIALKTGMTIIFRPLASNTGAASLNLCGLGVKSIKQTDGTTDPANAALTANRWYLLTYDGTVWQLPAAGATGTPGTGTVTSIEGYDVDSGTGASTLNGLILPELAANNVYTGFNDYTNGQFRFPDTTYAALPAAAASTGKVYRITDALAAATCAAGGGTAKCHVVSDGTSWLKFGGSAATGSSPLTTKGDIYTRDASGDQRLPISVNGRLLAVDSSAATGMRWDTPANLITPISIGAEKGQNICATVGVSSAVTGTTLTDQVSIPISGLAINDMVRLTARVSHAGGVTVAPRYTLIWGAQVFTPGTEVAWTATDLDMIYLAEIRVVGAAQQFIETRGFRSNGTFATGVSLTAGTEAISGTINLKIQGKMTTGASGESVVLQHYCVEIIKTN